jgi:hypothetical protein
LAIAVPVAIAALWRPVEEAWLLRQVRTGDRAAGVAAAMRLANLQCARAIPALVEAAPRWLGSPGGAAGA